VLMCRDDDEVSDEEADDNQLPVGPRNVSK